MKKKKKKKEEKEEERDEERERHRHDVWSKLPLRFTNGGRELRTVRTRLTRLCLAGRVPVAASKDRERSGEDNPSERIKPRRRGTYLSCSKPSTLTSPGDSPGAYFAGFAGCSQTPLRKKKKEKKGRCAQLRPRPLRSLAAKAHHTITYPVRLLKKLVVYTWARWGVELGRGTAVPTVPTQTVSSSVVADRSVFSSKPRLSAFVRSWAS